MKRFILYILTLFLFFTNTQVFAANFVKKEIKVQSVDKFNIVGTLSYPKLKGQKEFKTVISGGKSFTFPPVFFPVS